MIRNAVTQQSVQTEKCYTTSCSASTDPREEAEARTLKMFGITSKASFFSGVAVSFDHNTTPLFQHGGCGIRLCDNKRGTLHEHLQMCYSILDLKGITHSNKQTEANQTVVNDLVKFTKTLLTHLFGPRSDSFFVPEPFEDEDEDYIEYPAYRTFSDSKNVDQLARDLIDMLIHTNNRDTRTHYPKHADVLMRSLRQGYQSPYTHHYIRTLHADRRLRDSWDRNCDYTHASTLSKYAVELLQNT